MARVQDRLRHHHEQRIRQLWDAHHDAVLRYCRRRCPSDEANDALAETFSVAWRKADQIPDDSSALFWLYAVAGRVISNQRRVGSRRQAFLSRLRTTRIDHIPSAESVVVRRAQEQAVVDSLSALSGSDREILLLAAWEELPHAAIGQVLGLTTSAVAQRLARAKKRLAREFARIDSGGVA